MKKVLALALAAALGLSAAACGKPADTPAPATSATTAPAANAGDTAAPASEPPADREVLTIRIMTGDDVDSVAFDPNNDKLAALILEKFGIMFDASVCEDTEQYVLMAASDDLPDVFYNEPLYYISNYINFIEQGYVRDIPQAMLDKYPNVKNIVETSDLCKATTDLYGGNYVIPKPDSMDRSLYVAERRGIFYRKDWAAKFGVTSPPTNAEDLYTMLRHFTFDDPDGNGKQDTWGLSSPKGGEIRTWFISWGIDASNWIKEDGKWIHGQLSERNIEPLKFFRQLYEEGILDPEFAQIDYRQAMQKLAGGTVGAITRNADTDWINKVIPQQFGSANTGTDPFDMVDLIPIMSKDAASEPYMHEYLLDMTGTQFSSKISDEKLERYLEFHNWIMSPEGQSYKLGFEGEDWERAADGSYRYIKTADGMDPPITDMYKSVGLLYMPSWGFELQADYNWPNESYGTYAKEVRDMSKWARDLRNPHAVPVNMIAKLISTPSKLDADAYNFSNAVCEIIMGTEPVEKMFNDMVNKAMDSGFRQAIEDVNAYMQSKGY